MADRFEQLKELGSKLESLPSSKDALAKLLKQAATCLSETEQMPSATIMEAVQPFFTSIVKPDLLKHHDRDIKLLVATCICEITRITAPEAPFEDDVLKDIFHLIVGTFSGLSDTSGPSFGRRVIILEILAKYRSCVVMLDLDCDDLVKKMFSTFFAVASDDHPESLLTSMQKIMEVLLEESEEIHEDLLLTILSTLGRNRKDVTASARKLAMDVIQSCSTQLEPVIKQFLVSSISGDSEPLNKDIDYHEVIYDLYVCAPQILSTVVPYLTGELLNDHLDTRLKAVRLVGDLFSLPGRAISEAFQPIFCEFLKRLTDRAVEIRLCALEHVKNCLLCDTSRAEAPHIISVLCDRLLDYDENVRKQVVAAISDVACQSPNSISVETIKQISDRLRDKSPLVKKYTMEKLADIFRVHWAETDESVDPKRFDWIPGKILRCFFDKDFRSDAIESVLCGSLFPAEVSMKDKAKCWIRFSSGFDKVEIKALEKILEQKQRLQQEMHRYLSFRQMYQNGDVSDIQKKVQFSFRIMSRFFADSSKAEENFQILDQLKDMNVWKILTSVLDPNTSYNQASVHREDLLKILGEKHRLYEFLSTLSVKCSYLLINKEHAKEVLAEVFVQKSAGNSQYIQSCMDTLVILARYTPSLLIGLEEELVSLLKDDNDIIKEGALHILAKAGAIIREQLAVSSSSVDLILERMCLEGSRRQAKYAVHALGAITKDDGLKSLSVLYKRLVDMLEEKTHLPAVLQSLGCIAEIAMPVFETRENEIEDYIKTKILSGGNKAEDDTAGWDDRSELCLLKIYGIKTLVKSYLPVKDSHLRHGIDGLLEILRNILSFGEIAENVESSSVDKAHMKLAAAKAILRLSRYWDHKIPVDVFHLTLKTPEIGFPQARKLFLGKVHQYIKDRLLDVKYACAFLFEMSGCSAAEKLEEERQNLAEIMQIQAQAKARQQSSHSDSSSSAAYPEYILSHVVHTLAHQLCPDSEECKDVKAFEPVYRKLYLILSLLVHGDEDGKSETDNSKDQETASVIISVFRTIQRSEDIIEATKSKNSHAICDLGMLIVKLLAKADVSVQGLEASVSLPSSLYKLYESKEGDESEVQERRTWLADENILSHFESLKLETENIVSTESPADVEKDNEKEEELPLKKIMRNLKPASTKTRKAAKKPVLSEKNKVENDIDVLKMVREINIDNLGISTKYSTTNGHERAPSKENKVQVSQQNGEKSEASDAAAPKKRRSVSAKSPVKPPKEIVIVCGLAQKSSSEFHDANPLISYISKSKTTSSRKRKKGLDEDHHDDADEVGEVHDDENKMETDKADSSPPVSPHATSKKKKRISIAGLSKCTTKETDGLEDLTGRKIKVWWPLDKAFYRGTIKSYDVAKKKHVILYEDGDVEILNLEKERWELIDKGPKSSKKPKSSKSPLTKSISSSEQKNKTSGSPLAIDDSLKIAKKGKRTPKKRKLAHGEGLEADIIVEDRSIPDFSEAEASTSGDEDMKDDLDGPDVEGVEGGKDGSRKRVRSRPKKKAVKDITSSLDRVADEQDQDDMTEKDQDDAADSPMKDVPQKSDEEKEYDSDSPMHDAEKPEEEKDDAEEEEDAEDQTESIHSEIPDEVAEIPDDEPLNMWKRRISKSGSKKVG